MIADLVLGLLAALLVGAAREPPLHAAPRPRCWNSASSVIALGDGNRGIRLWNSNMPVVSTCSATSSVLRQPSCQASEESMARISAGGLEVVAGAVELEPVGSLRRLAGLDAQQRVVRVGVLLVGVVRVVGDHAAGCRASWRSPAGRRGPGSRSRCRGPSARGRSSPRRRCPGSRRRPAGPRRTGRAAAGSAPRPTGSRWWRSGPCRGARARSWSIRGHLRNWPSRLAQRGDAEQVVQALVVARPDRLVRVGAAAAEHVVALLVRLAPKSTGAGRYREPGATYASMPMIGVTPAALACL